MKQTYSFNDKVYSQADRQKSPDSPRTQNKSMFLFHHGCHASPFPKDYSLCDNCQVTDCTLLIDGSFLKMVLIMYVK